MRHLTRRALNQSLLTSIASAPLVASAGGFLANAFWRPNKHQWKVMSQVGAPSPRSSYSIVWTGDEVIVWGGYNMSSVFGDGARYSPASNSWTPVTNSGAPTARRLPVAVWTGTEMLIVGGDDIMGDRQTMAGAYNPTTNSWSSFNADGYDRNLHQAVWTGSEMLVWGGNWSIRHSPSSVTVYDLADGGRYHRGTNTWQPMSSVNAPEASRFFAMVWTGTELIIWGGVLPYTSTKVSTGARYNPTTDTWTPMTNVGAPHARSSHSYAWTGSKLLIWGGANGGGLDTGGLYDPSTDTWQTMATYPYLGGRYRAVAVWTGSRMLVWNGDPMDQLGAIYNPHSNSWVPMNTENAPSARVLPLGSNIWTGSEMVVWGGSTNPSSYWSLGTVLNSGGVYKF